MREHSRRAAGAEYVFATRALRESRRLRVFQNVIAASCFGMALIGLLMQVHPAGPHTVGARVALAATSVSAAAAGVAWLFGRWPGLRGALAFVVWADVALVVAAMAMSTPETRLLGTLYLSLVGVFVAFLLSPRIVYAHCLFCAAVILAIVVEAVVRDQASVLGLSVAAIPAAVWEIALPLGGLAVIDGGRRAIARTARSAHYDPLTGLLNRRGLEGAVRQVLGRAPAAGTLVVVVFDIDKFKRLNDRHGHDTGDAALVALARALSDCAEAGDVTARIGGDELVLLTVIDGRVDDAVIHRRFDTLTRLEFGDGVDFTVSVGLSSVPVAAPDLSFDDVLRDADSAMYDAKRRGGGAVEGGVA